jgi:O-acetyl-ADP-ribose deacetylase (regulator of RNase III)
MISYVTGDLFESPAQTLVNTVNTVGVMGKGIALNFKKIYPEMFKEYQELCERNQLKIGTLFLYRTSNKLILNFPTKRDWRHPSRPEYIEAGLQTFRGMYDEAGIYSIAFPPLGCGNGELDFSTEVQPLMEKYLADLPIPVFIFAPRRQEHPPEHRTLAEIKQWLKSEPDSMPFSEVWRDLEDLLARKHVFETRSGSTFEASKMEGEDAIRIKAGKNIILTRDELKSLWRHIKRSGMLTTRDIPPNRERDASYILPLFAELDYVDTIALSGDYEAFKRNPSIGIQLVPGRRSKQRHQYHLLEK